VPDDTTTAAARNCPYCHAELAPAAGSCWLCHRDLATGATADQPSLPVAVPPPELAGSFSLSSLMLFVTLAAVLLGVITITRGLGVPLAVVAFVVWVRTATTVEQLRQRGKAVTVGQKIRMFLASFGMAVVTLLLVAVAGCAALCSACFAMFATGEKDMWPWAIGLGVLAVAAAFAAIKRLAYGRRRHERQLSD
jgi:hypothetical protein